MTQDDCWKIKRVHLPLHWSELPSHSFEHHIKWMGTRKLQMLVVESKRGQTFLALQKQKSESLEVRANIFSIKSISPHTRKGSHGLPPWSAKLLSCWRVAFSLAISVTYTAGRKGSEGGMQFWFWLSAWSWGLLSPPLWGLPGPRSFQVNKWTENFSHLWLLMPFVNFLHSPLQLFI